jgi:hypothetical protein
MCTGRLKPEANKLRDAAGCTGADSFELLHDITKIMHAMSANKKSFRVIISRHIPVTHPVKKTSLTMSPPRTIYARPFTLRIAGKIQQAVEKVVRVVRQAHHERLKTNEFNSPFRSP